MSEAVSTTRMKATMLSWMLQPMTATPGLSNTTGVLRMRKLRGPNKKMSMPFEPFRTHTQAVNLKDLDRRFDSGAEVTVEALVAAGERFDIVLAMTNGQWETQVLANYMFDKLFRAGDWGVGSASAMVIMLLVTPILIWNVYNARKEMR